MLARFLVLLFVGGCLVARGQAPAPATAPATPAAPIDPAVADLRDAYALLGQGPQNNAAALAKVNDAVARNPTLLSAYIMRGGIYFSMKQWAQCEADFNKALQMDPKNIVIKFQLAEVPFLQKDYATSRQRFAAMESDSDMGDLAAYYVFLCDLAGGQTAAAQKEYDTFNDAGENPSYYFANAAWDATHGKLEDASGWLRSAVNIYITGKNRMYAQPLKDLGILDQIEKAAKQNQNQ
jgi:Tfp pilus assembly protein PilF